MADLYEPKTYAASPSSSDISTGLALDRDDFSVFVQNLLQSSSSSSFSSSSVSASSPASLMSFMAKHMHSLSSLPPPPPPPPVLSVPIEARSAGGGGVVVSPEDRRMASVSADVSDSGCREGGVAGSSSARLNLSEPGECFPVDAKEHSTRYLLSFAGGAGSDLITAKRRKSLTEIDLKGLGFDSEGPEAIDVPLKSAPSRSASKRSRAAEVHNLSEKRRRSRINEKMKALQLLIPNSNKTDKASMLDEAIDYLKQLQLQVQMLSMRNGSSLNLGYVPGVIQPVRLAQSGMSFEEGNGLPTANQRTSMHSAFDIHNQRAPSNQAIAIPTMNHVSNSESSFCLEQSVPAHYEPFTLSMSSKEACREEDTLPLLQLDMSMTGKNSSDASS